MDSLEETLKELDGIVRKHQGLARRERKIWNRLKLATEDLDGLRNKLIFHVTAINAFTSSLSRGSLARIERGLFRLVNEVQHSRLHPSLASMHETDNDNSIWRELESAMTRVDVSAAEIARRKVSIDRFIQGLLSSSIVDTTSLVEPPSLTEFGRDKTESEYLLHGPFAMDPLTEALAGLPTKANTRNGSLTSLDGEEYESADERFESADEEFESTIEGSEGSESADEELQARRFNANSHARQAKHPAFEDALAYVDELKALFAPQPVKYDQFLYVMGQFKLQSIDFTDVIDCLCALFICHPKAIQGFSIFLPDGYGIEYGMVDNHSAFRVIRPDAAYVRIPDVEAMKSLITKKEDLHIGSLKWIDPASLNILQRCSEMSANWMTEQSASQGPGVTQARMTFQGRLKTRLKATKGSAVLVGRADEADNIIDVNERKGLMRIFKRALQPATIKLG